MRIIAGTLGGLRIRAPAGQLTRPTSDRVREALFSLIEARRSLVGARVLDLYAGSGALAFEALSRGANAAVLVDSDRRSYQVIRDNARALRLSERCQVACDAVERWLSKAPSVQEPFDLVLMDPPYRLDAQPVLETLADSGLLARDALVALEHASRRDSAPTGDLARSSSLERLLTRRYGDSSLSLYAHFEPG